VDGMAERDIPLHVFHFDCFWMKEFHWCNFEWDARVFPDPEGMLKRLHQKGLKICVWINPYIAQRSALFDEGMQNGYLLKRPDGSVWQWDRWQSGMGADGASESISPTPRPIAGTRPSCGPHGTWGAGRDGRGHVQDRRPTERGDGERIPTDVVYHDGSDPVRMHNYYPLLYNRCVFEVLEDALGKGQACVFARSATTGGQQFPVTGAATAAHTERGPTFRVGDL
jgi:alpha-D-xyloside xylohydrolase